LSPGAPDIKGELEFFDGLRNGNKLCVAAQAILAVDLTVQAIGALLKYQSHGSLSGLQRTSAASAGKARLVQSRRRARCEYDDGTNP